MQLSKDLGKIDAKEELFCPKWTEYNGSREVYKNFRTDTDKLNVVVYKYQNDFCLRGNEIDLKMSKYEEFLEKRIHLLNYIDMLFQRCIGLDEITIPNWSKFHY